MHAKSYETGGSEGRGVPNRTEMPAIEQGIARKETGEVYGVKERR